ncbi:MAG: bifunctional proline dehydrogenase/L-glutamate gamma-semialdehyde dehydrogenase PutA [Pseudomonadota bacterium]
MYQPIQGKFTHAAKVADEATLVSELATGARLSAAERRAISEDAARLVTEIRSTSKPTMMEHFLAEYGLSTSEGVALMCLAEAMLRVPDTPTIDALIEDKIAPSDWGRHLGTAASPMVNASTWALMLTGRVLDDDHRGMAGVLRGAIKRLGEPVIRTAVGQAMKQMGAQFVLGQTIEQALNNAQAAQRQGYTYSYDMLGEAAMTAEDAARYAQAYGDAITAIAGQCVHTDVRANPGISVKLSALHPRYEVAQSKRVMSELVPVLRSLVRQAKAAGMGLNIDAEEQDRLVLSLEVIEAVLADPELAGWDGFGVVVQAYGKRAGPVIDWLAEMARRLDRKLMVRLVKGAYWDTEIKHAQVEGHADFPVFTTKAATDVSYIACARKLLDHADRLYPQFATHNAHTVAAVRHMAGGANYEFQRLHGMGERLHDLGVSQGQRCRIYAPVGAHRDLLAYLVRRLLENGANSSFVNQIVDADVSAQDIAADPFEVVDRQRASDPGHVSRGIAKPAHLFPGRTNSTGFDLSDADTLSTIDATRVTSLPDAAPLTVRSAAGVAQPVISPTTSETIAHVTPADKATALQAIADAKPWVASVAERARILTAAADLYEANAGALFSALAQEAGKTLNDCVGELREAVDFLRFYAEDAARQDAPALGRVTAISPWNFPLAIFTGQIAAALAAGNAVLAKPAEQTPVIAAMAVRLLHAAGVPVEALQLLPGDGATVGAALTSDARIDGVVFTGSTATAHKIRLNMANHVAPGAPLIAETGGLNAMIVDSTALPEQAVRDIVASAFQSAGQRCSALRCLYVQADIAPRLIAMIKGAMDELRLGDPKDLATDIGPVIDPKAKAGIENHIAVARNEGRVLHQGCAPKFGTFVAPTLIRVNGIADLEQEVFGPVLHVATFEADELDSVIDAINATGYGLTFGLHTRIDTRVQHVIDRTSAGNTYVNRNQIGAVVGSQPFGGHGLSGTGPKAGGPLYLSRFVRSPKPISLPTAMPGPTGEANTYSTRPRLPVVCLGPGAAQAAAQARQVVALGGLALERPDLSADALATLTGISGAITWSAAPRPYALALSQRPGPIMPLITGQPTQADVLEERHLCIDTTAAGGNAALLAGDTDPPR